MYSYFSWTTKVVPETERMKTKIKFLTCTLERNHAFGSLGFHLLWHFVLVLLLHLLLLIRRPFLLLGALVLVLLIHFIQQI